MLGQHVRALGAEPAKIPAINEPSDFDFNRPPRKQLDEWPGRRWHGKYSVLLLWSRWDLFDVVLFMDADHLVLRNIDNLLTICGDAVCAINDKSHYKTWDLEYFNSGVSVLHPNEKDFNGLVTAFTNNTLTHGKHLQDELDKRGNHRPPKHDEAAYREFWFRGGQPGSLVEQDILNAYFRTRVTFLADGYNAWASVSWPFSLFRYSLILRCVLHIAASA